MCKRWYSSPALSGNMRLKHSLCTPPPSHILQLTIWGVRPVSKLLLQWTQLLLVDSAMIHLVVTPSH